MIRPATMTKNLLTLAAQLQSMEDSMISIMFDVATKMASVSDINFFLLIENQGRIQFTGSPHLNEAYSMSNFSELLDSDGPDTQLLCEKTPMPKVWILESDFVCVNMFLSVSLRASVSLIFRCVLASL